MDYFETQQLQLTSEIIELLADCFATYDDQAALKARISPLIEAPDTNFFVAKNQQQTVGLLITKRAENNFLIEALAVTAKLRHQHIASELIGFFIKSKQPQQISLETDDDSLLFYQKNRFELVRSELKYQNCRRYTLLWQAEKNTTEP
ncbi:GNAT family N-acetyltransferase [Enterococcus sp. LJL120]